MRGTQVCHGLHHHTEHEMDEGLAVRSLRTFIQRLVVLALMKMNKAFNGNVGKEWLPVAEYHGLPKSYHAAIAVSKRVNEFKLVVEYTAGNQRVYIAVFEPALNAGCQTPSGKISLRLRRCHRHGRIARHY